jgi:hypothetical protein
MKYPKMKTTVVEQTSTTIVLDIEHAASQSWSKAVDPKAMRVAKGLITGGNWAMVDTTYGFGGPRDDSRSVSRYYFRKEANA